MQQIINMPGKQGEIGISIEIDREREQPRKKTGIPKNAWKTLFRKR